MNHSCFPNVAMNPILNGNNNIFFVATKNIKKGDELFWKYYSNKDSFQTYFYLYEKYYFQCQCEKCLKFNKK